MGSASLPSLPPSGSILELLHNQVKFLRLFLVHEQRCSKVDILFLYPQCLRPYYVSTAMTHHTKPNLAVPSPETFVRSALPTLATSQRNCGYWSHALQVSQVKNTRRESVHPSLTAIQIRDKCMAGDICLVFSGFSNVCHSMLHVSSFETSLCY